MTKLTFRSDKGETVLVTHLYKIVVSDQTKNEDRLKIRQMARILDKLEEFVKYESVPEGMAFMLRNPGADVVLELDNVDYDRLYQCLKTFHPTAMEVKALDKLHDRFEAVEKD